MQKERFKIILEALNIADDYSFLKPVEETELLLQRHYSTILGDKALQYSLSMVGDPKHHLSRWDSILQNEIKEQNAPNEEALSLVEEIKDETTRNWRIIFLINHCCEKGDIEFAESLISRLPDNNDYSACQYVANRIVLRKKLDSIDLQELKKRIKLCKPAKTPKNEVIEIKKGFIENQSQNQDWETALKIAKDRLFGTSYYHFALYPETKRIPIREMINRIDNDAHLSNIDYLKARVLIKYAYYEKKLYPDIETFEIIFKEVDKIDKSIKENGNRLKDMLAFDLGCSTDDLKLIARCKKIITNPMTKRELGYHFENIKKSS